MMQDVIRPYLQHLSDEGKTKDTLRTYRQRLTQFERWLGAQSEDMGFSRVAVRRYLDSEQAAGKRPRTLRPAYAALRGLAEWMNEHDLGGPDLKGMRAPRLDAPGRYTPSDEEMLRMWAAADALPDFPAASKVYRGKVRVVLCLLACTAIRRCELLNIRVGDIDQSGRTWFLLVRKGKGNKTRRIPVNAEAQSCLREWLEIRAAWAARVEARAGNEWLLPVDSVRPVGENTINAIVDQLNHIAKPERRVTPHCIRHWAATRMASQPGVNIASIGEILGHSDQATTHRYLHAVASQMEVAVGGISLSAPKVELAAGPVARRFRSGAPDPRRRPVRASVRNRTVGV